MVQGMGGMASQHWNKFKQLSCEAYNIIRKSTNLILNLVSLMIDANITDISREPERSLLKVPKLANSLFFNCEKKKISFFFPP